MSARTKGLVPATCPEYKTLRGEVPTYELAIFASKSRRKERTRLNFWDKSLRFVPQNALCELFVGQDPGTSPFV